MIAGIENFYYFVQNMTKSVNFYRDVLGMSVIKTDHQRSQLSLNNIEIALHSSNQETPPDQLNSFSNRSGGTMTLRSTNIEEDLKMLRKIGSHIVDTSKVPWGSVVEFTDPDGNILNLVEPT